MPVALFPAAWSVGQTATAHRPITIKDYRRLVQIQSPRISPDGREVVFVHVSADMRHDRSPAVLEVADLGSGITHTVIQGPSGLSSPRWAPNGQRIAFIQSDGQGVSQIYTVPVAGGAATQISHVRTGVQQFAWSPRGERIAYVARDEAPGHPDIDLFDLNDVSYLTRVRPMPSHLWTISANGGAAKRLTKGPWSVLETGAPFIGTPSDPSWSADGKWIAFARQANPYNSRSDLSTIAIVSLETGEVKQLTGRTSYEYQPAFSAMSNVIAYLLPHGPTALSSMDVGIAATSGGAYDLTGRLDRDVTGFVWSGRDLVVEANEGVLTRLWRHFQNGKDVAIPLGALSTEDFDAAADGAIAFVASTGTTPQELYYLPAGAARPRKLTNLNAAFGNFIYGKVTGVKWTSPDGETCDGVLTYPVGYVAGQPAPLVVWVHGGPEAAALAKFTGFEGDYLRQTLAGEGYVVFQPNYRGSDNLGNHHEHAIYRDPGEGPAKDVLAGIDRLVASGIADAKRITIAGHSYGGYMTTWLIAHDHRWLNAIVADGAVDWRDTYNVSSDGNLAWARDSLGGGPTDEASAELYRTGSPITYAKDITTPTFIISGTADETVPITESYALYHAIKDQNVPVRFVGVPGAHHTPDSPNQYERFYLLMAAWVRKWNPAKRSDPGNPASPR